MKKEKKNLLIISSILIVIGIVLATIGVLLGGFPGLKITKDGLSSASAGTQYVLPKTQLDDFTSMDIQFDSIADAPDIILVPSADTHFYLEYTLNGDFSDPEYEVENQTLTFQQNHVRSIVAMNFQVFTTPKNELILYIPKGASFTDITIRSWETLSFSNLSLTAENVLLENMDNNNKLSASKLTADSLTLEMNRKRITANDLTADAMSVSNNYGTCNFTNLSCKDADIVLDNATLTLDAKSIGQLSCEADYGDITLILPNANDAYDYDISVEYGTLSLPDAAAKIDSSDSDRQLYQTAFGKENKIQVRAEDGDVTIKEKGN